MTNSCCSIAARLSNEFDKSGLRTKLAGRWRATAPAPAFLVTNLLVADATAKRGAPMPANSAATGDERDGVGLINLFGGRKRRSLGLPSHHRERCSSSENCELRH